MSEINSLDLKKLMTNAVSDVFDTMLSMEVESVADDQPEIFNGGHIDLRAFHSIDYVR